MIKLININLQMLFKYSIRLFISVTLLFWVSTSHAEIDLDNLYLSFIASNNYTVRNVQPLWIKLNETGTAKINNCLKANIPFWCGLHTPTGGFWGSQSASLSIVYQTTSGTITKSTLSSSGDSMFVLSYGDGDMWRFFTFYGNPMYSGKIGPNDRARGAYKFSIPADASRVVSATLHIPMVTQCVDPTTVRAVVLYNAVEDYPDDRGERAFTLPGNASLYYAFATLKRLSKPYIPLLSPLVEATAGDPVNLADGIEEHTPPPDLAVYNPHGPAVSVQRELSTYQAKQGYGSPGLSPGWVHSYDITIDDYCGNTWGAIQLIYQNGGSDELVPALNADGTPNGAFSFSSGSPCVITGDPGTTEGKWDKITITWQNQEKWIFEHPTTLVDGPLVLTRLVDRLGHYIDFEWDNKRRLTQITNDEQITLLSYTYRTDSTLASVTDAYGRTIVYLFATLPEQGITIPCLTTVSQLNSNAVRWQYSYITFVDPLSLVLTTPLIHTIEQPSPTGNDFSILRFEYDTIGRVVEQHNPGQSSMFFSYQMNSTLVQTKDDQQNVIASWVQLFNQDGFNAGRVDSSGVSSSISYDDANNPYHPTSKTVDGKTTSITSEQYGNIKKVVDTQGTVTENSYNYNASSLGRLTSSSTNGISRVNYTYLEPYGLVKTISAPRPGALDSSQTITTTKTYDLEVPGQDNLGNVISETRPGPEGLLTITYNYTNDGAYSQPAKIEQPLTEMINGKLSMRYRYNERGNVAVSVGSSGKETRYSYNLADQVTQIDAPILSINQGNYIKKHHRSCSFYLYPGGPLIRTKELTVYLTVNNEETVVLDGEIIYEYDDEGQLLRKSGDTQSVSYTYDALGHVIEIADGHDNRTRFIYDSNVLAPEDGTHTRGRLVSIIYPDNRSVQFTKYDTAGHVLEKIDGNDVKTSYEYTSSGKIPAVHYSTGSQSDVRYYYDSNDNLKSVVDSSGYRSYEYDTQGNMLNIYTGYDDLIHVKIEYTYNPDGSRHTMKTPSGLLTYRYDDFGNIIEMSTPSGRKLRWRYDSDGRLRKQTLGNYAWTQYEYDDSGRTRSLTNYNPSGRILSEFSNFTFDGQDNYTGYRVSLPGQPRYSGEWEWQYDRAGQITSEQWIPTAGGGYARSFSYDLSGNLRNPSTDQTSNLDLERAYNQNNQWIGFNDANGQPIGQTAFLYDGNGNPTIYNGNHLTYDVNNGLTAYGNQANTEIFTAGYRSDGKRAWKESNGHRTYYLYDGNNIVCEFDGKSQTVSAYNLFGPTGLVARKETMTKREIWYQFDPVGNVVQRLDISGRVLSTDQYDAYGNRRFNDCRTDPFGFGGQVGYITDYETGLILCGRRYYHPNAGRFLTRDPIGANGGINVYLYCNNNPINIFDPTGLEPGGAKAFIADYFEWWTHGENRTSFYKALGGGVAGGVIVMCAPGVAGAVCVVGAAAAINMFIVDMQGKDWNWDNVGYVANQNGLQMAEQFFNTDKPCEWGFSFGFAVAGGWQLGKSSFKYIGRSNLFNKLKTANKISRNATLSPKSQEPGVPNEGKPLLSEPEANGSFGSVKPKFLEPAPGRTGTKTIEEGRELVPDEVPASNWLKEKGYDVNWRLEDHTSTRDIKLNYDCDISSDGTNWYSCDAYRPNGGVKNNILNEIVDKCKRYDLEVVVLDLRECPFKAADFGNIIKRVWGKGGVTLQRIIVIE